MRHSSTTRGQRRCLPANRSNCSTRPRRNSDDTLIWRTSSHSGAQGDCVQVAETGTRRLVRDSKVPDGPVLGFSGDTWTAFLRGIRSSRHTTQ
ncbi:DUF397 domain-containing protein [Streptomyces sp. NPDC048172]|uniref:DUF397 domain-containing protein n=1 Tax=Streptomyces sp. NPDC048172 TaxID=3365505 RepID=UPI003716C673